MSETCNHSCGSCSEDCAGRTEPASLLEAPHRLSHIKKVIGVVSGKGGVGKSSVTAMLAVLANRMGLVSGVLDADITGPSIPKLFGVTEHAVANQTGILPVLSETGIKLISVNLLLDNPTDPVLWRGPIVGGVVKQFWKDVVWGDVDVLFLDMPPGTGDVALTAFQSIPLDGIILVTSPQELVSMIVSKAVKMAEMMNVPILGLVENLSYVECPDCGRKISVFGESHVEEIARQHNLKVLAKLPIDPALAAACDGGSIESYPAAALQPTAELVAEWEKPDVPQSTENKKS